mgnify:CR=1 FL=1
MRSKIRVTLLEMEIPFLFFIWALIGYFGHKESLNGAAYLLLTACGVILGGHLMSRYTVDDESEYPEDEAQLEVSLEDIRMKDRDIKFAIKDIGRMIQSCTQCSDNNEIDIELGTLRARYDLFVCKYEQVQYNIRFDALNDLLLDIQLSDGSARKKWYQIALLADSVSCYRTSIMNFVRESDDLTFKAAALCVRRGCLPDATD